MIYLLIRCKFCRDLSTGQTQDIKNYTFKCRRCNKSHKLWDKRERIYRSRVLAISNNPQEISRKCQVVKNLKMEEEALRCACGKIINQLDEANLLIGCCDECV